MNKLLRAKGLGPVHARALRIAAARAAEGLSTRAEDIRWDDFSAEALLRHPYLRGKRDEKLVPRRAASVLLELQGAGALRRSGGADADPEYMPSSSGE